MSEAPLSRRSPVANVNAPPSPVRQSYTRAWSRTEKAHMPLLSELDMYRTTRKVDVRVPGKGNSNSHGARPVQIIHTMMK